MLSIAKSLAAPAATRAAAEGWLDDSEQVANTLGEWRDDRRKSRITVAMLLQQTAGLEAGVAALYRNPADKGRKALAVRAVDVPGRFSATARPAGRCWPSCCSASSPAAGIRSRDSWIAR